jgi:uncharacterized UPF0146 family protein
LKPSAFSVEAAEKWALQRSRKLPADLFRLMAFWYIDFFVQWVPQDRKTRYTVRLAQSENYGLACGLTPARHDPDPDFVGKDTRQILRDKLCADYIDRIALVDLLIARVSGPAQRRITLDDTIQKKYGGRSRIFADEAERVLRRKGAKNLKGNKPRAVMVGASSGIIEALAKRGFEVFAADLSPEVVGKKLGGITVRDGKLANAQLMKEADVAIITGITLTNRTLPGLMRLAKKYNTSTIIWAITGKNFGYYYTENGVDCVISDFLMLPGPATLTIWRRKN